TRQTPRRTQTNNVSITYLLQNHTPATKLVTHQILPSSRQTVNVNTDLQTHVSDPQISVAAIVQVTSGPGIVAERPMYFSFQGIQSGTDVIGATAPGQSYYFSEGSSVHTSSANYSTYVSILNPSSSSTASVTITYYTGSCTALTCPTEKLQVPPLARATGNPAAQGLHTKLAIRV